MDAHIASTAKIKAYYIALNRASQAQTWAIRAYNIRVAETSGREGKGGDGQKKQW